MKRSICFIILLLLAGRQLPGQNGPSKIPAVRQLLEDRLAKGLVFDMLQDRRGFMWFGTEFGLVRYDGYDLRYFQYEPGNPYSLSGNVVTSLLEDGSGYLWVGTLSSGLHRFDPETERFIRFSSSGTEPTGPSDYRINDLALDQNGDIWIATEGGGINRWNKQEQYFDYLLPAGETAGSPAKSKVRALHFAADGRLWAGTQKELLYWDPAVSRFLSWTDQIPDINTITSDGLGRIWIGNRRGKVYFVEDEQLQEQILPESFSQETDHTIHDLITTPDGALWIGTDDGLLFFDEAYPQGLEYFFPNGGQVFSFFYSNSEFVWMGTNSGVIKLPLRRPKFQRQRTALYRDGDTLRPGISAVTQLSDQRMLIGTFQGPFLLEKESRQLHRDLSQVPGLSYFDRHGITALWKDRRGGLWIGSLAHFDGGFELFRLASDGTRTNFSARYALFSREVIRDIGEDRRGNIWFGTGNGLVRYDPQQDTFQLWRQQPDHPNSLPDNHIRKVYFDGQDRLWVGTDGGGLALYRPETNDFLTIALAHNQVLDIIADTRDRLWLATQGGLNRLDPATLELTFYSTENGLPDNTVKSLLFDRDGYLWIGTKNGFARMQPDEETVHTFNLRDGIQQSEYWERVCLRDQEDLLFFGGAGGFNYFDPDSLSWNTVRPSVILTELRINNQKLVPDPESKLLPKAISFANRLELDPEHKVMTFRYAALNYHNTAKNQFAYQLVGFDPEWQYVGDRREVTYTNLDAGKYTFRIKATNDDGYWNEEGVSLELVIHPPWYASRWAYLTYFLLLTTGLYFIYRFQLNRRLTEAEARRLRELDAVKTQLYTNITHEFRTPLTLIQGPVEKALKNGAFTLDRTDLERIRQNCRRLLHLIRQMLHLNRLEAGALTPDFTTGDVLPTIKYIVDSFSSFAESQEVTLDLDIPDTPVIMPHDPKKLIDILSNLISNAVKFTPKGGKISVTANRDIQGDGHRLMISVRDTGTGIPKEELAKIFDRFYQVRTAIPVRPEESASGGAGIGLALSKKLAELMGGTLTVKSTEGKGSTFYLGLPIQDVDHVNSMSAELPDIYVPIRSDRRDSAFGLKRALSPEASTILIVEDNADVANFIAESLSEVFQVHICGDGKVGLAWATEHIPDLIISDVLMPRMDGYELTQRLKNAQKTSHIPLILLTAKADLPSRLAGFEGGADAYMVKPFNEEELLIRIENLLASRQRLQQYYLQESGLQSNGKDTPLTSVQEHSFLKQVRELIEDKLESGNYSIESLANDLHMSNTQLYRKMTALTGMSPSKFYRHLQIKKAKEQLLDTDLPISEIAYRSGFNDPAYFSRVFTAESGDNPSKYRDRDREP